MFVKQLVPFSFFLIFTLLMNCSDSASPGNGNLPPVPGVSATISAPAGGQAFAQNQVINFSGDGREGSSGILSEGQLLWRSDKNGLIGIGNSFTRSGLSIGDHQIILTATADDGESGEDTLNISIDPPANQLTVQIHEPAAGIQILSSDLITLRGSANAPDGSAINADADLEWRSNIDGFLGNGLQISPGGLTPQLHRITLTSTLRDSSGNVSVSNIAEISFSVAAAPNAMVDADILAPANGHMLHPDSNITFIGTASNQDGQPVGLNDIIWTSSMDNEVGRGQSCIVPGLSEGIHRITMTVSGSSGHKKAVSILVEVRR